MLAIHVISNGDLFVRAFNAVATICGANQEKHFYMLGSAIKISALFAILGALFNYIKTKDISIFFKWVMLYFVVITVLLGVKTSVVIIDSSNPGAVVQPVDYVPIGIAYPASIITSVGHALTEEFEEVMALPDDLSYSKTGFLFGSNLFRLSTGFHITDPDLQADMNEYVKNCVIGDILINNKYTIKDLVNSTDVWKTISQKPSPIRGMYLYNKAAKEKDFLTCVQAAPLLKAALDNDVNNDAFTFFDKRIFGGNTALQKEDLLKKFLPAAYDYYADLSSDANAIMTQNIMTNAVRSGIINYASEKQASAALLNLSATVSMAQMRLSWGSSRILAAYFLPMLQTILMLILICSFPLIVLLAIQLDLGISVFKNYIYSIIWIESWPLFYAILNICISSYIQHKTMGLASGGITLSNSNELALEHLDIANVAGYLTLSIPLFAAGLVKGMTSSLSYLANHFGGMVQSTAASIAGATASGNISLGNMSYNNINANKHDTNYSNLHGLNTNQLSNGALVTRTPSGEIIYNTSPAMSQLATSVNIASSLSESYSKSAESSKQAATSDLASLNKSSNLAASSLEQWSRANSLNEHSGDHYSTTHMNAYEQAMAKMNSAVTAYAASEDIKYDTALSRMTQFTASGHASGSAGADGKYSIGRISVKFSGELGASIGANLNSTSTDSVNHGTNYSSSKSHDALEQFKSAASDLQSYTKTHVMNTDYSVNESLAKQFAANLTQAESAAQSYSANMTKAERSSELANYAKTNSESVQNNLTQDFVDYVRSYEGDAKSAAILNGQSQKMSEIRNMYAQSYVESIKPQFESNYFKNSANINPDNMYQHDAAKINAESVNISRHYANTANNVNAHGSIGSQDFNHDNTKQVVKNNISGISNSLQQNNKQMTQDNQTGKIKQDNIIAQGAETADITAFRNATPGWRTSLKDPNK